MATAYTPILQLALPVTGELQGTWGTVVNDNITSMIEQAIAGLATVSTWTAASHTLTTANGTTDEARCAVLECSGAPGAAATVVCPALSKVYVIKNSVTGGYAVTLKTSAGTGISVPNGSTALLYCDGTNVVSGATYMATLSTTQVDILAQGDLRLQDTTGGEYVALQAPATIATSYTLTLPVDDGTAGQALITDGSGVLSWSTAASGDVYGPASATDNAVARFDLTTGKLIQNSVVTIADDGATVIAANSGSDGLRITQIGAGNAILVEDSANPDATPFVVEASGDVLIGTATAIPGAFSDTGKLQIVNNTGEANQTNFTFLNSSGGSIAYFNKSRSGTVGTNTIVQSGDALGDFVFAGADGTTYHRAAQIGAAVDGTPGVNDMPGRLVFSTTADGASSPTERMRIDSAGQVGIGGTPSAGASFIVSKNITGATTSYGNASSGRVQSDVTTAANMFFSNPKTAAAAFTLSALYHFGTTQGAIGAGSTVTNQYGFFASSTITGATNNYGFYSDIASGTGRWNFYAAGTADNYFAGALGLGSVPIAGVVPLNIGYNLTGGTSVVNVRAIPSILSDVTTQATIFKTQVYTQAAAFTLSNLIHYDATLGSMGATSAIANQYGFNAAASLIGATNNYGFLGNIASGTGRFNFYAGGTAANVFVGTTSIGGAVGSESLRVTPVASAVNYWESLGASTGVSPVFQAVGSDTNVNTVFATKGTGAHLFRTNGNTANTQFLVSHTASAVNYLQVTGGATTSSPFLAAQGSDANIHINYLSKGVYGHIFTTGSGSNIQFYVANTTSAVNYITAFGNTTGSGGYFQAAGSDTNISMLFSAKGTGEHVFYTAGNSFTKQFTIAHVASAVNYLQVTGAATGNAVAMSAQGSDTNIPLAITSKGSSPIDFYTSAFALTQFRVAHTASAVDYLQVTGNAGSFPGLSAQGASANVAILYTTKGSQAHYFQTNGSVNQFLVTHTASAVNYLQVTGAATSGFPTLSVQGSDTNIPLNVITKGTGGQYFNVGAYTVLRLDGGGATNQNTLQLYSGTNTFNFVTVGADTNVTNNYYTKGTGSHSFFTNGAAQFNIANTASAVNFLQVTGGATGVAPILSAAGSDTNIDLALTPKGTGVLAFGTLTANADAPITGYITIKDSGGTTRKLAVIA